MTQGNKIERFWTVEQFRNTEGFNAAHAAHVCVFEAMQPNTNLKNFLAKEVFFGNKGKMQVYEVASLARELFTGTSSKEYVAQLQNDNCLGFSPEELLSLVETINTPLVTDNRIALALGFNQPKRTNF